MALDQAAVTYLTKSEVRMIDRLAERMNMSRSQAIRVAVLSMIQEKEPRHRNSRVETPFASRRQRKQR